MTLYRILQEGEPRHVRLPEGAEIAEQWWADLSPEEVAEEWHVERAREAKWAEVKRLRDLLERGAAPTPLGPVQCDDGSKIKIAGLVQMAQIAGEAFEEVFTLADNETVVVNAADMIAMGVAVGQYVSGLHAAARALRVQITEADTVEAVEAIVVDLSAT